MRVVITGAGGLIGWHAAARLHAANCGARFRSETEPYDIVALDRTGFNDDAALGDALSDAGLILHFAGINRASEEEKEHGNIALARRLAEALDTHAPSAALVYANSIHESVNNAYGRGKRCAAEVLSARASRSRAAFVDLVLPNIFGEGGRPFYNNVTGTLCHQITRGEEPQINPEGQVELVHAGDAAQTAIDLGLAGKSLRHRMEGLKIDIPSLHAKLAGFHERYTNFVFPDLSNPFDVLLFNTYRQHLYPDYFPHAVTVNTDTRGRLFECVRSGGGGQSFVSWTKPGVTRGEHFHIHKVERFLVIDGTARIAMRKVLTDKTHVFHVNGEVPACVDMPTLWTHNITNIGTGPLVTLFWTNNIFDPSAPDTYADKVGEKAE